MKRKIPEEHKKMFEEWVKPNLAETPSEEYKKWAKQANLPPLTLTQAEFAEWLLREENIKVITQIGNLEIIFVSVYKWLKYGKNN